MCYNSYDDHYGESKHNACVHTSSGYLFWSYFNGVANHFKQRYNRNVVASIKQYSNHNLHVYTNCGAMCYNSYDDHNGKSKHYAYIHTSDCNMFRSYFNSVTNHF